jgi:hypothetical protein
MKPSLRSEKPASCRLSYNVRRGTQYAEDGCLLGCCTVQSGRYWPTFRGRLLPLSSRWFNSEFSASRVGVDEGDSLLGWAIIALVMEAKAPLKRRWTSTRLFWARFRKTDRGIGPSQGLYLHRTAQYKQTRTQLHASRGIRRHDDYWKAPRPHAPQTAQTHSLPS